MASWLFRLVGGILVLRLLSGRAGRPPVQAAPDGADPPATPPATPGAPGVGVSQSPHTPYEFESSLTKSSRRAPAKTDAPLKKLRKNLGIADDALPLELERLLVAFVLHHHLNIDWYERRIRKERFKHGWFFVVTLALLVLIPFLTFWISERAGSDDGATIAVQITAVLTGIIGVHNALRSLFEKRNVIALFHKASATLKRAVYDFEDRWRDCVPTRCGEPLELFKANVRDHVRRAREVEAEEQEAYFAAQAFPLIDLGSALTAAGATAAEIVGRHVVRRPRGAQAAAVAPADVLDNARTRVDALRAKLAVLTASAARAAEAKNVEQRRIVEQGIVATRQELRDAEQELLALSVREFDDLR